MKTMTTLAAVIATIATMSSAVDVDTVSGTSTQQDIKHIFSAAQDLTHYYDNQLPPLVETVYNLWPTVIRGIETTTDIQHVTSVGISGGNFLADTRGVRQVTERGEDVNWRDFQANRDMTLEAIDDALFGAGNDLDDVDTNGFLPITHMNAGDAAPTRTQWNEGIVGTAIDTVINDANLANWNAVRANGMTAAGLALQNSVIISDIIDERVAINRVLNEYDEAKAAILAGDL